MSGSTMNNKEWGYRTSNLVSYPTSTPNANIPNATIDDNASYKAMTVVDNSTKSYGELMEEVGNNTNNTTIPGNKATKLAVQVAAKGDATLPADRYQGKVILSVVATPKTITAVGYMQNFTTANCNAIEEGATEIWADNRDEKMYLISRLADGNCWMTQNLALGGNSEITLTPTDSNVVSNFNLPASSDLSSDYNVPKIYKGTHKDATQDNSTDNTGTYYNWSAAVATSDTSSITTNHQNVSTSICPKGWALPSVYGANSSVGTSTSTGQFRALYDAYDDRTNFDAAWRPGFPGSYLSGSQNISGSTSYWWSSTVYGSSSAYILHEETTSSNIYLNLNGGRYTGFSVRCVFTVSDFFSITTLQEMNRDICDTVPTPTNTATAYNASKTKEEIKAEVGTGTTTDVIPQTYLQDTRKTNGNNNYSYTVRKLADGNCWMVQNLYLTAGTALSDQNTHLTTKTSYAIPSPSKTSGFTGTVEYMNNGSRSSTSAGSDASNNRGSYFSWKTATAASVADTDSSGSAPDDICPKGWKLPTGGSDANTSQFQALYNKYGSKANFDTAWYVGTQYLPGVYNDRGASDAGKYGDWWSSTLNSDTNAHRLFEDSNRVLPDSYYNRGYGFPVRCVAE